MTRNDKIAFLQQLSSGTVTIAELRKKTVNIILPANDGSKDWIVINKWGMRRYTAEQFEKLNI